MMLHPGRATDGVPTGGAIIRSSALQGIEVEYTGKPAHAGLSPWEGVNALDASVVAYNSISALRQQLKPETRVQGIITDGGSAVNVIPARSTMSYQVRGASSKEVSKTVVKVESCFSGAATVTGCKHSTDKSEILDELRNERSLGTEWANVMQELYDAKVVLAFDETMGASTDFGNITHKLPACHPMFGIQTPPGAFNHTPEFTAGAGSQQGFDEAIKATTAMACVGVRYLVDDTFATQVRSRWEKEMKDMEKE
jgi:metal-dependent amidase/aminoacylase/carboxypeptidase family protein